MLNAGPSARIVAVPPMLATRIIENLSPTNPSLGIVHDANPKVVWRFENSANGPVNSCFDCDLCETGLGHLLGNRRSKEEAAVSGTTGNQQTAKGQF